MSENPIHPKADIRSVNLSGGIVELSLKPIFLGEQTDRVAVAAGQITIPQTITAALNQAVEDLHRAIAEAVVVASTLQASDPSAFEDDDEDQGMGFG